MNPDNIFWDRIAERAKETLLALSSGSIPRIIRYAVHVTSACNMRCKYCHDRKPSSQMIDRSLFSDICKRAGTEGIVHITGGEPSLVPWIYDEIVANQTITKFAWNSNLLRLPPDDILRILFRVKTSLDDYHADRWNDLVGGDFFDKVVANIKRAIGLTKHVSVSYTATHKNAHRFDNFIRFCQDQFPGLFSISASFYKGDGDSELALTSEDLELLFEHADFLDPVSKQIFHATHNIKKNEWPENIEIPCYLSMSERLFDEFGREFYCSHLFRDGVTPPGRPGLDHHCVTGCNARFYKFNKQIHDELTHDK
jgi:sulfatase maturation enzyme AslB (radical SAM superfamily)